jgi:hypothetical protein
VLGGATIGKAIFILKKKIFSRTRRPISVKLTNHLWIKRIKNCFRKGSSSFSRGDNHRNAKIGWDHLNIFFSKTIEPEELIFT